MDTRSWRTPFGGAILRVISAVRGGILHRVVTFDCALARVVRCERILLYFVRADYVEAPDTVVFGAVFSLSQRKPNRAADAFGYAPSYLISGAIQAVAIPFLIAAKKENAISDPIETKTDNTLSS